MATEPNDATRDPKFRSNWTVPVAWKTGFIIFTNQLEGDLFLRFLDNHGPSTDGRSLQPKTTPRPLETLKMCPSAIPVISLISWSKCRPRRNTKALLFSKKKSLTFVAFWNEVSCPYRSFCFRCVFQHILILPAFELMAKTKDEGLIIVCRSRSHSLIPCQRSDTGRYEMSSSTGSWLFNFRNL